MDKPEDASNACDLGASILTSMAGGNLAHPGLTATMGLALLTTMTLHMNSIDAIPVLICTYIMSIYGGSRSAILLNIPGTPSSAATALDGYVLARQGRTGEATGLATIDSVLGTLVGFVVLAVITPP